MSKLDEAKMPSLKDKILEEAKEAEKQKEKKEKEKIKGSGRASLKGTKEKKYARKKK